jgi:ribosome-associated protein
MTRTDHDHLDAERPAPASRIELAPGVWINKADLRYAFSRGGGPGGQNVNKVNTRAELRVALAAIVGLDEHAIARLRALAGRRLTAANEIVFTAQSSRSQRDNKRQCLEGLQALVERAWRKPLPRKKKRVTRAMKAKRLGSKREHGERKARRRWRADRE